jgi:hypothetical protein
MNESEEKTKIAKEIQFYEQNKQYYNHFLDQLKQQLEEQKVLISAQQKNLNKLNAFKGL